MESRKKGGWFKGLLGLIFGGIAGAIVGILYAPQSGQKTREQIREKSDEILEQGKEVYTDSKDKLEGYYESSKETASGKMGDLKEKIGLATNKIKTTAESVAETARDKFEKISKTEEIKEEEETEEVSSDEKDQKNKIAEQVKAEAEKAEKKIKEKD